MIQSITSLNRANVDSKAWPVKQATSRTFISVLLMGLYFTGCASFKKKGPVADNIVACRSYSQQATQAMQQGEWQQAEGLLSQAIAAYPLDVQVRRDYAETLWKRGAKREAIRQLKEASELCGEDPETLVSLGGMYLVVGNLQQAEFQALKALEYDIASASAWRLKGDVHHTIGKLNEALACYLRGLTYQPNDYRVLFEVAEIYRAQNRPQRALATLENLSDRYSPIGRSAQVLFLKGLAYKALHRYEDSIEVLAEARRLDPESVELLYHLGQAEFLAGKQVNGRLTVEQALKLSPDHSGCRDLLAEIQTAQLQSLPIRR